MSHFAHLFTALLLITLITSIASTIYNMYKLTIELQENIDNSNTYSKYD